MGQLESQLPAADVRLTDEILDRIDELVPPGVTVNPEDNSYGATTLIPAALRRGSEGMAREAGSRLGTQPPRLYSALAVPCVGVGKGLRHDLVVGVGVQALLGR